MYYNRTISECLEKLLCAKGELRWLFDFVKKHQDLDFLIGKNDLGEWISVYRGLSRILSITQYADQTHIKIDADQKFKALEPGIYGRKKTPSDFSGQLESLVSKIRSDSRFTRYYENRKEGFFQNELSRKFGINGTKDDAFVVLDKGAAFGYASEEENTKISVSGQTYEVLRKAIPDKDKARLGVVFEEKLISDSVDFLALDSEGNILLIEHGCGDCTAWIRRSPLQLSRVYDLFTKLNRDDLNKAVYEMFDQKQRIGLIHPDWKKPKKLAEIIPVLIISEFNYESSAKEKFNEILEFVREKTGSEFLHNLKTYNYTTAEGLTDW